MIKNPARAEGTRFAAVNRHGPKKGKAKKIRRHWPSKPTLGTEIPMPSEAKAARSQSRATLQNKATFRPIPITDFYRPTHKALTSYVGPASDRQDQG